MSNKNTLFYRKNTAISIDFSAEQISSDGSLILLEKLEREHKVINYFSKFLPDSRNPRFITYTREAQLKQRVFMVMLGYEDANDVTHLQHDPLFKDVLQGDLASQPTISRFENSHDKHSIFALCTAWVDKYVSSLAGRKQVIIDIDATDDSTYGKQQLSMFNGYYGKFMYNELFFHDGETGQIILPVLRPGNSHSNKWYVSILKRIIIKIRKVYPDLKIIIRTDSGFSCAPFYKLVDDYHLLFATGVSSNAVLKRKISRVESTGLGMNVRHIISNLDQKDAREIYFGFYVKRGETSENRIKEVKNMCFSDRLSNHSFWANFIRLLTSSLAYEMFLLLKQKIKKTTNEKAKKWQISSIRTYLLKIGATIKITKRRIYYRLSKAFVYKDLFREIITQ